MNSPEYSEEPKDLSLVLGGPLFHFYRRLRLSGDALELAWRRTVSLMFIAWVPLLVLSFLDGNALHGNIKIPFLYDLAAHVRFLVALPILVAAELIVHQRVRPAVQKFIERKIVLPEDLSRFNAAIDSALRLRNSFVVESLLLILVYTLGLWIWRNQIATELASWYAQGTGVQLHLTRAGYWYAFVSIPLVQFILLRWYWRFFIWFQFLWRVSRLNLHLVPTHPDRAAGLGFLGTSTYAFTPILFAQGALLAGLIANRVLYEGQNLMSFKLDASGMIVVFVFLILSPLLVFSAKLADAKRQGLAEYGGLASRYVQEFEGKWIATNGSANEDLLGTGDIQSLADIGTGFNVVQETRPIPFGYKDAVRLAVATAAPLLPLTLTVISLEELIKRLIKILL